MNHEHTHSHGSDEDDCCSVSKPYLSEKEAISKLQYLDSWVILEEKGIARLNKTYPLSNFRQGILFLEHIESLTREFNHHPVAQLDMHSLNLTWHTYTANGLTDLDFASAEACDAIYEEIKNAQGVQEKKVLHKTKTD